jgi:hypothetical protein
MPAPAKLLYDAVVAVVAVVAAVVVVVRVAVVLAVVVALMPVTFTLSKYADTQGSSFSWELVTMTT